MPHLTETDRANVDFLINELPDENPVREGAGGSEKFADANRRFIREVMNAIPLHLIYEATDLQLKKVRN